MFKAIRSRLVGAWRDLRSRGLIGLFFFELLVVTLGVLLAQGIADWTAKRGALSRMENERQRNLDELAQNYGTALVWQAAMPCLEAQLEKIMNVSDQTPLEPGETDRPSMLAFTNIGFDAQSELLLRERYGAEVADGFQLFQTNLQHGLRNQANVVENWGRLRLVDPTRPEVDATDRQYASETAADLLNQLVGIRNASQAFVDRAQIWRIEPAYGEAVRPVRDCAELWSHKSIGISSRGDE